MNRKSRCLLLSVLFLIAYCLPGCVYVKNTLMFDEDEKRIMQTYSEELSYISAQCGRRINGINTSTIDAIKGVAYVPEHNSVYNFEEMMKEIALAIVDYTMHAGNMPTDSNGHVVAGSEELYAVASGVLKGEILKEIPVGDVSRRTFSNSITMRPGDEVQGQLLTDQIEIGETESTVFNGPLDGTKLTNGKNATERIVFNVLCGTLIYYKWDYINDIGQLQHIEGYLIEPKTAYAKLCTTWACFSVSGQYWGIETVDGSDVLTFSSEEAAKNEIVDNPGTLYKY